MNPKLLSFSAAESQTSEGAVGGGWAVWLWPPRLCLVSWPTPPDIRDNSHSYGDTQGRFKGSLPEHSPPFHCSFPGPPSHRGGTPATGSSPRPQRILHSHLMLQPSTTSAGTWYPPPRYLRYLLLSRDGRWSHCNLTWIRLLQSMTGAEAHLVQSIHLPPHFQHPEPHTHTLQAGHGSC